MLWRLSLVNPKLPRVNFTSLKLDREPCNPRLAGSAEANGMRRGGNGRSCHSPTVPVFFFFFSLLFLLKIVAGLLLNKTWHVLVYCRVCVVVLMESVWGETGWISHSGLKQLLCVIVRCFPAYCCYSRHVFSWTHMRSNLQPENSSRLLHFKGRGEGRVLRKHN